jgi:hypothetical protein
MVNVLGTPTSAMVMFSLNVIGSNEVASLMRTRNDTERLRAMAMVSQQSRLAVEKKNPPTNQQTNRMCGATKNKKRSMGA